VEMNKQAAADEVKQLSERAYTEIALVRSKLAADRRDAATALTDATKELGAAMLKDKKAQQKAITDMTATQDSAIAATASKLAKAKKAFASKVDTLTNSITANSEKYVRQMQRVTGQAHTYQAKSKADRARIKNEVKAMGMDLRKAIGKAIQLGEARLTEEEKKSTANQDGTKKFLINTIDSQVEDMADAVFATVNENRQKIADNYISLKAYTVASKVHLEDYMQKGGTKFLGSIGDLLKSIGGAADIPAGRAEGVGAGADSIPAIFSGKKVEVKNPVNKINFMVNEYMNTLSDVRARWPLGLGKYLLTRVEQNMQDKGILEVDKVQGKTGNFVFINAHSVGLSSKLTDFETLAVKMSAYQTILKKLTAKPHKAMPAQKASIMTKPMSMGPPEWQGD